MEHFRDFLASHDEDSLKQAGLSFLKAFELRRDSADICFYLSFIFYLFNRTETAISYYYFTEKLNPAYPNLQRLKEFIFK